MTATDRKATFKLEEAISILEATPAALHSLLAGLPDAWLHFKEEPQAWNSRTILVHYIHNELTNWMPRVRVTLLAAEERTFPPFQQLPELSDYEAFDLPQLFTRFADLRQQNLSELRNFEIKPADFSKQAEHPVLGTVNLRQLLASWVVHDLNHLHQIAKTLAKRYREEVGPWRPNLPILDI